MHLRIALASVEYPPSPEDSVTPRDAGIADAGAARADIICFPECYVPGYRGLGHHPPPPDQAFLERAWSAVAQAAAHANVAVILGTERIVDGALRASALVVDRDGSRLGFQDNCQVDPSEDNTNAPSCAGPRKIPASLRRSTARARARERRRLLPAPTARCSPTSHNGQRGLLIADLDVAEATGLLAGRLHEPTGDVFTAPGHPF